MNENTLTSENIAERDTSASSKELVREVANWKLEAKNEDNDRYFFHVNEVSTIEEGNRCYVIGRKGSGKTAISEYLGRISASDTFSEKLTFKNFPFNELYVLKNSGYTGPNQYITLWKYVIYSTICKLMAKNENISSEIKSDLERVYGSDTLSLDRRLAKWVGKEFSLSLFGLSLKVSRDPDKAKQLTWIERVAVLEDVLLKYGDSARYFVIFDELDEDYRNIIQQAQYEQYTGLVTSLFKAVQDIKSIFRDRSRYQILPIVFLRDDIYEIIQDSDKNKWNDFKIELNWNEDKIRRLVAFRISRALNPHADRILSFEKAWEKLVGRQKLRVVTNKKTEIDSFDFIARSTYLRPRDFVKYLQACAEEATGSDGVIHANTIRQVDTAFSNYLKDELRDELFAILPDIWVIFDVISQIGKWNFTQAEFDRAYQDQAKRGNLSQKDVGFVLQVLFLFSVIGNARRHDYYVFRYLHRDARLSFNDRIVVHRGLFKSLQIV
jgi:energy-coupling factor transporter ATP-binding protein EcfA2